MTKNIQNFDMQTILKKRKRKVKRKDTDFTVKERSVSLEKIERYK